mmetsp:Transcript_2691/g.6034  ORF Transcript_2691/g.6034 Transcript_2691/m.6034 type:complete len:216 (+) Transcript_2691:109-756(+)
MLPLIVTEDILIAQNIFLVSKRPTLVHRLEKRPPLILHPRLFEFSIILQSVHVMDVMRRVNVHGIMPYLCHNRIHLLEQSFGMYLVELFDGALKPPSSTLVRRLLLVSVLAHARRSHVLAAKLPAFQTTVRIIIAMDLTYSQKGPPAFHLHSSSISSSPRRRGSDQTHFSASVDHHPPHPQQHVGPSRYERGGHAVVQLDQSVDDGKLGHGGDRT